MESSRLLELDMMKSRIFRWATLGTGLLFAGLGLGSCGLDGITGILPVAVIGALLGSGGLTQ